MSLDISKLECVRELSQGVVQARCPACAEAGSDRAGNHLRIYRDGRFGCCVHAGDREHRRRIFALAGDKRRRPFTVKVSFAGSAKPPKSILECLSREKNNSGTLGTPIFHLREYKVDPDILEEVADGVPEPTQSHTDTETGVPSVPSAASHPHLLEDGTLVIPFSSPERYHWWRGGQSVEMTRAETELKRQNSKAQ